MRRKRFEIYHALKPGHLTAIGLVAAHWSSLEVMIIGLIARIAEIPTATATIMVSSSNFTTWLEILRKLTIQSKRYAWKEPGLIKLCGKLQKLHTQRNNVVHACWLEGKRLPGLINSALPPIPQELATGVGVPKRGLKVFIPINLTAAQMRETARMIQEGEQELLSWWVKPQLTYQLGNSTLTIPDLQNPPTKIAKNRKRQ